jgi:hypothetical protein
MISQKFGDLKSGLLLQVIRNDALSNMIGVSGGRFAIGALRDVVDRAKVPAETSPHEKPVLFRDVLKDFCKRAFEALRTKLSRALQNLFEVSRL